jgi:hypothetical protein
MKLKAVRGKNQFGYSFISDPKLVLKHDTVAIRYEHQVVYSILRTSENVPTDTIIIDYRLFDELGCTEDEEVDIRQIDENIPMCGDITLSLTSLADLDNTKVAEAVSKRIEDLKPFLDGLIVREGQIIQIPDLKIKFIVTHLNPSAGFDKTARISWVNLLRISINPMKSLQCYNVILLLDLGTVSDKSKFFSIGNHEKNEYPQLKALTQIFKNLFKPLTHCNRISLFASIAYSSHYVNFQTYDKTTGDEMEFNNIDSFALLDAHENWLMQQLDFIDDGIFNPGNALEKGLELAKNIYDKNNLHTMIILFSDGAYSSGPNPVKIAKSNSCTEISIYCFAFGPEADLDFLGAIAKTGGGDMVHICSADDIATLPQTLERWMTMR